MDKAEAEPRRGLLVRLREALAGRVNSHAGYDLEREIQDLVEQGQAQGLIGQGEGEMIDAVLDLAETTASQIITPRTVLVTVAADASLEEMVRVAVQSGHSRIPIYEGDLDHIVGVMHAKDLLPLCQGGGEGISLTKIARRPMFVPQSMPLNRLLSAIKRTRSHLAIVVDEYGGTAGVVTLEDVLEEIVGDIADEYDQEESLIREEPDGSLLVDGRLDVGDLAERLDADLPEELPEGRFETVGGLITTYLGRVPRVGEEVRFGAVCLMVKGADERRVTLVLARNEPARQEEEADAAAHDVPFGTGLGENR
jgi:magnesium and cobalt transporter